jgi:hypothetical protein
MRIGEEDKTLFSMFNPLPTFPILQNKMGEEKLVFAVNLNPTLSLMI